MSAPLPAPVAIATDERDQFVVSHGKSGVIGVFTLTEPTTIARGDRVIVQSSRGLEIGEVLGPASIRQARLFGATSAGLLVRSVLASDDVRRQELARREQDLFELCRERARGESLSLEILDVDLLFDGLQAIVQFVGEDANVERFAQSVEEQVRLTIRMENLATPAPKEEHHHCDKPDCGRESGGCTSCSTGGGCSTCGSSKKVDMREYFGHLRAKMEKRIPLA
jgi:hypothetical protein